MLGGSLWSLVAFVLDVCEVQRSNLGIEVTEVFFCVGDSSMLPHYRTSKKIRLDDTTRMCSALRRIGIDASELSR